MNNIVKLNVIYEKTLPTIGHSRNFGKTEHYSGVRLKDIWDRLGNFRELQLVDTYLGNLEPIVTHAGYPSDPRNQIAEH